MRCQQVLAVDEIPLAYLPGGVVRLHVKVVGDLKIAQLCPQQYHPQNQSDTQLSQSSTVEQKESLQQQPTSPATPQQQSCLGDRLSVLDSAPPAPEPQLSAAHQPEPFEPQQPPPTPHHPRQPHDPHSSEAHHPKPPEPHHPDTTDTYQPKSPEPHHSDPSGGGEPHHPQTPGPHHPSTAESHHPDPSGAHCPDPSEASLQSDDMAPAAQGSEAGRLHSKIVMASAHAHSSTGSLQPSGTPTAAPAAAAAGSPPSGSGGPEAGAEADSVPQSLGHLSHSEGSVAAATAEWVITKKHVEALAIGNITHHYFCYCLSYQMHASQDQVLARCVQQQSTVSRLVCFGQACTTSTQVSEQISTLSIPGCNHNVTERPAGRQFHVSVTCAAEQEQYLTLCILCPSHLPQGSPGTASASLYTTP